MSPNGSGIPSPAARASRSVRIARSARGDVRRVVAVFVARRSGRSGQVKRLGIRLVMIIGADWLLTPCLGRVAGCCLLQPDDHRLRGRSVAAQCRRVERNQWIGLGIVGRCRTPGSLICHDPEGVRSAEVIIALPVRYQIDEVAIVEAELFDVLWVDKHHPPTSLDAAVAIAETIDGGIELIMTAHRLQDQMTGRYLQGLDR